MTLYDILKDKLFPNNQAKGKAFFDSIEFNPRWMTPEEAFGVGLAIGKEIEFLNETGGAAEGEKAKYLEAFALRVSETFNK